MTSAAAGAQLLQHVEDKGVAGLGDAGSAAA